ncbi:MAG: hypothetical protein WAN46_10415 [Gammaproteobacteria bacterium]|jgi:hypothetical protein
MTIRTSKKTLTLRRPFVLGGFEVLPAGAYSVDTDDELLEPIYFPAYRRVVTLTRNSESSGAEGATERKLKELGPDFFQLAVIIGAAALLGIFLC